MGNPLWVIVANATQAHVFERPKPGDRLIAVVHMEDFSESIPAQSPPAHARPDAPPPESLSSRIADRLRDGRIANRYGRLEVFAGDAFRDELLSEMQLSGCRKISCMHNVDLADLPLTELRRQLDRKLAH